MSAPVTVRAELARWVLAARAAVEWHREGGDDALPVPAGWRPPPLGAVAPARRAPAAPALAPAPRAFAPERRAHAPETPPSDTAPTPAAPTGPAALTGPAPALPASDAEAAALALHRIQAELGACTRCGLCRGRSEIVFGGGAPRARILFVADAPGPLEDALGLPFVGEAGGLLGKMIQAMGLRRAETYLTYLVKCSPGPRDLEPASLEACRPFFDAQLDAIAPEVIVALGAGAAQILGSSGASLARVRGEWLSYRDRPVMPTLHPTALLQNPRTKREVWTDLKKVMRRLGLEGPAPRRRG